MNTFIKSVKEENQIIKTFNIMGLTKYSTVFTTEEEAVGTL